MDFCRIEWNRGGSVRFYLSSCTTNKWRTDVALGCGVGPAGEVFILNTSLIRWSNCPFDVGHASRRRSEFWSDGATFLASHVSNILLSSSSDSIRLTLRWITAVCFLLFDHDRITLYVWLKFKILYI